ncbi:hypothetical protein OHA72_14410 [Dactylosporangium sp. NBC_01737]|uniref:hypothetical protein n=1 Tax=Dactylosporangium sp. NBC_01737 TaxID=2975959 RepID=UPI002E11FCC0|nr:hypothetical protein OHA72_14410 [Dactylosporangium sp. NBC_01737]
MSTQPPDPTSSAAPHPAYAAGPATSSFQPQPQPQGAHAPAPVAAPVDVKKARALTMPYRELAAFVLLGVAGAFLLAGFIALLTTLTDQFLNNAGGAFSAFVSIETVALPILAVLLATHLDPVVPKAKLIVLIALIEYAVAALFGLVMLLASLIGDLRGEGVPMGPVLAVFLTRLGTLSLLGLGLFLVIRVYLGAYAPPKPPPGVYGQPAYPYGPQQGYQYPQQQQYAQHTGYQQQPGAAPQQAYQQQPGYPQQQPVTGAWTNPATTGTGQVVPAAQQQAYATQPINYPAAQASGAPVPASGAPAPGYNQQAAAAPGYNPQAAAQPYNPAASGAPAFNAQATGAPAFTAPASGAPAYTPQPAAETTGSAEPVSAAPASTPPLSSPFATYTAPAATQPVSAPPVTPPVSAPPAGSATDGGVTPPGGFAAAGWPGGSSTHPTSGAATGAPAVEQPVEETGDGAASPFGKTGAFPAETTAQTQAGADAEPETQAAPVSIAKADADPDATAAYTQVSAAQPAGEQATDAPAHTADANVTEAHPVVADPDATTVFTPAGHDASDGQGASGGHAAPAAQDDPDATTAFTAPATGHGTEQTAQHGTDDDGDDTQRTQVIPPKS